jgi:glycosyltransferase involved in cell wall biosynthesis
MTETRGMLSVMMPAYNEALTIEIILRHVLAQPEVQEVIAVDDGSTDDTGAILERVASEDPRVRVLRQPANQGKGAALRLAIQHLSAPFALVQDADLEYDPRDYAALLEPLADGRADAVNGVRGFGAHTAYSYWFVKGNQWLTTGANILFDCYLTDLLSGYKAMRSELWRRLNLTSTGFEVETEIMAKVVRLGYRFHEVPITYITRSREEGKKIQVRDGFRILGALARVRLASPTRLFGAADLEYHHGRRRKLSESHPLVVTPPGRSTRDPAGPADETPGPS